jgi:hypothetical protein
MSKGTMTTFPWLVQTSLRTWPTRYEQKRLLGKCSTTDKKLDEGSGSWTFVAYRRDVALISLDRRRPPPAPVPQAAALYIGHFLVAAPNRSPHSGFNVILP